MNGEEASRLLLAAKVFEIALQRRRTRHAGIDDRDEYEAKIAADPLEPYLHQALKDLRWVEKIISTPPSA